MNPSLILTWVFGLMLAAHGGFWLSGWFLAKLLLVTGLSAYHGWMIGYLKALKRGERRVSGRRLRMANEIPGVAAIGIVILAFVKPF
jgi:protoporphyrinogen IX oxidase